MFEETLLFLSAIVTIFVGFVRADCSFGDCHRRETCADRPWTESREGRNDDRVRIVDAPLGSDIEFLCNYCGEKDKGQARFWYTSHRMLYSNGTLAGRKEVVLGMSDPMESNRVYMTLDHRLVIRNLTSSDTGRYSCSGLETDERLEYALDLLPANSGGRPGADVVAVTADSMAGWTQYESRYLAPVTKAFPIVWKMDVDWDPWGPCDGCAGKRYRRAACRVCFDVGIRMACRSIALPATVMTVSPGLAAKLSTLPDFLLAETCYAYCQVSNKRRLPKYRNTFVLEEGSSLTLVCAEATADKKVISYTRITQSL
ncbi:unnamed protein product [Aphis gossypii]|uniref:Ig-like domain-containing protein n=1 Tax=Aphis gossypii TaxID=80765 RepID=A0A9P0JDQ4_APHGO|nr:unnamed protein product [Aphis gossypii]